MKIYQLFKMAVKSVISNKLRSFLTMLDIIIGISSVIILIAMGQGTTKKVTDQIQSMGTNLITVSITGNRNKAFTNKDIATLKSKPGIKDIAPALSQSETVKGGTTTATTTILATEPSYETIKNISVQSGRFITQSDLDNRYHSAVIGVDVANELYNSTDVVGDIVNINGIDFNIVGVLTSMGTSSTGSSDDTVILPLTTAQRLLKTTSIKTFYVQAKDTNSVDTAMAYLALFLNKKYPNTSGRSSQNYRIMNETSLLQTANSTTQSMTNMLSGIAAISLLVGGIGIMNIMLVSVMERTREIGIRKSLGAKRRSILLQFLIEAVFVSGLGGILGVLIGVAGSEFLQKYNNIAMSVTPNIVLISFGFSVTVGVVFGLYPASKASKLNPIDALRFE
jgi:putative ABC transport system permease protein